MEETLETDVKKELRSLQGNFSALLHGIESQIGAFQQTTVYASLSEEQKKRAANVVTLATDHDFNHNPISACAWYEELRKSLGNETTLLPLNKLFENARYAHQNQGGTQ